MRLLSLELALCQLLFLFSASASHAMNKQENKENRNYYAKAACQRCSEKKQRCNNKKPCSRCENAGVTCTPRARKGTQGKCYSPEQNSSDSSVVEPFGTDASTDISMAEPIICNSPDPIVATVVPGALAVNDFKEAFQAELEDMEISDAGIYEDPHYSYLNGHLYEVTGRSGLKNSSDITYWQGFTEPVPEIRFLFND